LRALALVRLPLTAAAVAVDLMAAVPLLSAMTLAKGLRLAVKNAIRLLDSLVAAGVAVEVTHRSKRRLFGLKGMAPLAAAVRPPYRPEPGRGRGRPPLIVEEPAPPPEPLPSLTPIERRAFDYSDLEQSMAQLELVLRETRRSLDVLTRGDSTSALDIDLRRREGADDHPIPEIDMNIERGHQSGTLGFYI
jgi:hypothetical protein